MELLGNTEQKIILASMKNLETWRTDIESVIRKKVEKLHEIRRETTGEILEWLREEIRRRTGLQLEHLTFHMTPDAALNIPSCSIANGKILILSRLLMIMNAAVQEAVNKKAEVREASAETLRQEKESSTHPSQREQKSKSHGARSQWSAQKYDRQPIHVHVLGGQ